MNNEDLLYKGQSLLIKNLLNSIEDKTIAPSEMGHFLKLCDKAGIVIDRDKVDFPTGFLNEDLPDFDETKPDYH